MSMPGTTVSARGSNACWSARETVTCAAVLCALLIARAARRATSSISMTSSGVCLRPAGRRADEVGVLRSAVDVALLDRAEDDPSAALDGARTRLAATRPSC
ncbi:MAG: hypothetical protein ACRDRK_22435 [Pseudonocardia sp.]